MVKALGFTAGGETTNHTVCLLGLALGKSVMYRRCEKEGGGWCSTSGGEKVCGNGESFRGGGPPQTPPPTPTQPTNERGPWGGVLLLWRRDGPFDS